MTTKPATSTRVEGVVLVLILLTVAGFAGAASFTHVKDWTLANSPTGTGEWFGWANAVISELVPIACLLTIRRRKRTGAPIGYPIFLLLAAAGLSLAAQLAVAKPGISGWLLSAVPALAFMALVKLVLSPAAPAASTDHKPTTEPAIVPVDQVDDNHDQAVDDHTPTPTPDPVDISPATVPAAVDTTPAPVDTMPAPVPVVDDPDTAPAALPVVDLVPAVEPEPVPAYLLPTARFAVVQHEQATGQPITPTELATRLSITPGMARQLLDRLTAPALNGTPAGVR